jgi:hypothetical protein
VDKPTAWPEIFGHPALCVPTLAGSYTREKPAQRAAVRHDF